MDVGLVGAGILSGILGAHIITMLRERLSLGAWVDSLLGGMGGGIAAELVTVASSTWVNATPGLAVGRIAAVIVAGILGGTVLVSVTGLFRAKRSTSHADDTAEAAFDERRSSTEDRRKGERRLSEHDG